MQTNLEHAVCEDGAIAKGDVERLDGAVAGEEVASADIGQFCELPEAPRDGSK